MKIEVDYFKNFRVNLQLLRIQKRLSAEQLSLKIGVSKKRVTDFEYGKQGRGNPKAQELFKLSKIFDVTVEDMIFKQAKITFL